MIAAELWEVQLGGWKIMVASAIDASPDDIVAAARLSYAAARESGAGDERAATMLLLGMTRLGDVYVCPGVSA